MSSGAAHSVLAASAARAASAPVRVSGIGFVTPIGRTVEAFDEALFAGRSAVRAQTLEIKGMDPMSLAVAACDFDSNGIRSTSRLPLDRGTAMALTAAQDAAAEAKLDLESIDRDRLGIFWGCGLAGAGS
ncbi:beta-ketoacyl synthase N-terminal-like domain-containing protein, partial [Variovorax atrisoli]